MFNTVKRKIHLIIFLCEICRKFFHPIEFVPKDFISLVSNFHSRNNCIFLDRFHKFHLFLNVCYQYQDKQQLDPHLFVKVIWHTYFTQVAISFQQFLFPTKSKSKLIQVYFFFDAFDNVFRALAINIVFVHQIKRSAFRFSTYHVKSFSMEYLLNCNMKK